MSDKGNGSKEPPIITLLADRSLRVLVNCGTGGVGKTTTSAALAIAAARLGRRVVVLTIDPAKRLATSLGLASLSHEGTDLTPMLNTQCAERGLPPPSGSCTAMMPDTTRTFEQFIQRLAGTNTKLIAHILKTPITQIFAREFSGLQEYMAMERLYEVYKHNQFDLIILDTPPAANTLTFLESPKKLASFFDDRLTHFFNQRGGHILSFGISKFFELMERVTGKGFISNLIEFTSALYELKTQFQTNLAAVHSLLLGSETRFLFISSPERLGDVDLASFLQYLKKHRYPFWGMLLNRMLLNQLDPNTKESAIPSLHPPMLVEEANRLAQNFQLYQVRLHRERQSLDLANERLRDFPDAKCITLPEQNSDLHSLSTLFPFSEIFLTAPGAHPCKS